MLTSLRLTRLILNLDRLPICNSLPSSVYALPYYAFQTFGPILQWLGYSQSP